MVGPINLTLDYELMSQQLAQAASAFERLPKRRFYKFFRKLSRLLVDDSLCCVPSNKRVTALGANKFAFEVRILGLDELICAALRAGKRNV